MERTKDLLNAYEKQIEKVACKLLQAADDGRDVAAGFLRLKLVKLVNKFGELLQKTEAKGRNVKQQIVIDRDGFDIEFFAESAGKSEGLAARSYEKILDLKISGEPQKQKSARCK